MRFIDPNIRLHIIDKQAVNSQGKLEPIDYDFKAFLEESKTQIKTLDTNIQYAPLNFTNNTQFLKTQYSVDLSFNVFSEDRQEAIENYDKLHKLLNVVKPNYRFVNNQYLPIAGNIFGLVSIKFSGLPRLSKQKDELDIYITNFAYTINKDMGFLELPYSPFNSKDPDRTQLFVSGKNMLMPIAYRLDISGRVLLPLEESIRTQDKTNGVVANANKNKKSFTDILNKFGTDTAYQEKLVTIVKNMIGDKFADLSIPKLEKIFSKAAVGTNEYIINEKGNPSEFNESGNEYDAATKNVIKTKYVQIKNQMLDIVREN
jgi:hypothetical protein